MENSHKLLRDQLTDLLMKGNAHATFEQSVEGLAAGMAGRTPHNLPYSCWQLIEHIRIAQADILDFCRNPAYRSLAWPDDYWPEASAPDDESHLAEAIKTILTERDELIALLQNAGDEQLYEPIAHGRGQNLLRGALLVADHTAYHTGQIILIRRLLGDWKD